MALVRHGCYSIVGTAGAGALERMKAKTKVSNPRSSPAPAEEKQARRKSRVPGSSKRRSTQSQAATRKAQHEANATFAAEQSRKRAANSPEARAVRAPGWPPPTPGNRDAPPGASRLAPLRTTAPAWNVFVDVLSAARVLHLDHDAAGVVQLLEQTDTWFAERLNPTAEVLRGAESLTEIAQWAGLYYRLPAKLASAGA
jgi:hypothetical protein